MYERTKKNIALSLAKSIATPLQCKNTPAALSLVRQRRKTYKESPWSASLKGSCGIELRLHLSLKILFCQQTVPTI